MKKILLLIMMMCMILACTSGNDEMVPGEVPSEKLSPGKAFTKVSAKCISGSTISYVSSRAVEGEEPTGEDCYFYIREDGDPVETGHEGKPVKYFPVNDKGLSMKDSINLGSILVEGIQWLYYNEKTPKYIYDTTGSSVKPLILRQPDIAEMLEGSLLSFNPNTQDILWYTAKFSDGFWHVDGVIEGNDKITIEFDPGIPEDLVCKADDFLVRVNGVYQEVQPVKDNGASFENILMSSSGFSITIDHAEKQTPGVEYTYEIYIWATPGYETLFSNIDIDGILNKPENYEVRYNVFKGLSGHNDTPYIKISLHVIKG